MGDPDDFFDVSDVLFAVVDSVADSGDGSNDAWLAPMLSVKRTATCIWPSG